MNEIDFKIALLGELTKLDEIIGRFIVHGTHGVLELQARSEFYYSLMTKKLNEDARIERQLIVAYIKHMNHIDAAIGAIYVVLGSKTHVDNLTLRRNKLENEIRFAINKFVSNPDERV